MWNDARPEVVEFLGAIRALVQENDNFNVVVSGLTSAILERGELFERENPFFAWASAIFLPRLTEAESTEILTHLGERMAVRWEADAASMAARIADGHVFLLRTLATRVVETLAAEPSARVVTTFTIEGARARWRRMVAGQVKEMLGSVARYYPDEDSILELIADTSGRADEVSEDYPDVVEHLIQLGLLIEDSDNIRLSALASFGFSQRRMP